MSDERPRPQYGEYAPEGWVSPHFPPPAPESRVDVPAAQVPAPVVRPWDRPITIALLIFGAYTVISNFLTVSSLPEAYRAVFKAFGFGEFTSDAPLVQMAIIGYVVGAVIWIVVAVMAARALQRGKLAFWWPLAGGVLATLILAILLGVVMVGDPAYLQSLNQVSP